MFKTAAAKIAHNSTIPSLGVSQDLRPLQDLIMAEKAVLISLQRLSVDFSKASEALRMWGLNEGDDLGDILSASMSILNHFSSALSQYASHGNSMREQLKAIRTKEENLDEIKRRRRSIFRKADDVKKKLAKMGSDHKQYSVQSEILARLEAELRTMDSAIISEEAVLGDFKRTTIKSCMGIKFGGLRECCEKGMIAGEYGKLTVAEISEETTRPGMPRSLYHAHETVERILAEAHEHVNMVTLSTVPSPRFHDEGRYDQGPSNMVTLSTLSSPRFHDEGRYDQGPSNSPPAAFFISPQAGYRGLPNNGSQWMPGESQSPPPTNNGSNLFAQSEGPTGAGEGSYNQPTNSWGDRSDGDPPRFEETRGAAPSQFPLDNKHLVSGQISFPIPAPAELGVDQPQISFPTPPVPAELGVNPPEPRLPSQWYDNNEFLLAYMDPANQESPHHSAIPPAIPTTDTTSPTINTNGEGTRRVRFNIDNEVARRVSLEKQAANTSTVYMSPTESQVNNSDSPSQVKPNIRHIPPPSVDDEDALDAAAARRIASELATLNRLLSQEDKPDDIQYVSRYEPTTASTSQLDSQLPHSYAEFNPPGTYVSQPYAQQSSSAYPAQQYQHQQQQEQQQQQQQQAPDIRDNPPPQLQASNNNVPVNSQVPQDPSSSTTDSVPQTNTTPQASAPVEVVKAVDKQKKVKGSPPTSPFTQKPVINPFLPRKESTKRTINAGAFKRIQRNPGSVDDVAGKKVST